MIKIGRYNMGWGPFSMIIIFIVLTACAVVSAVQQSRAEWPVPFRDIIMINETMALFATLIYGIIIHLIINIFKKPHKSHS